MDKKYIKKDSEVHEINSALINKYFESIPIYKVEVLGEIFNATFNISNGRILSITIDKN